jgi:hypothetical protein
MFFLFGCQALNLENMNADYTKYNFHETGKKLFVSNVIYRGNSLKGNLDGFHVKKNLE